MRRKVKTVNCSYKFLFRRDTDLSEIDNGYKKPTNRQITILSSFTKKQNLNLKLNTLQMSGYLFEYQTSTRFVRIWREDNTEGATIEISLYKHSNSERFLYQNLTLPEEHFRSLINTVMMDTDLIRVITEGKINADGRLVIHIEACERMRFDSKNCEVIRDIKGSIALYNFSNM